MLASPVTGMIQCPQCGAQQSPGRFCQGCGVAFTVAPVNTGIRAGKFFSAIFRVFAAIVMAAGGLFIYAVAGWHPMFSHGAKLLLSVQSYTVAPGRTIRYTVTADAPVDVGVVHSNVWAQLRQNQITEAQAMATAYCSQFNVEQAKVLCDIPISGASDVFLVSDPRTTTSIAATTIGGFLLPGIKSEGFRSTDIHVEGAVCQIFCGER